MTNEGRAILETMGAMICNTALEFMAAREGVTVPAVVALIAAGHAGAVARFAELTGAAVDNADALLDAVYSEAAARRVTA